MVVRRRAQFGQRAGSGLTPATQGNSEHNLGYAIPAMDRAGSYIGARLEAEGCPEDGFRALRMGIDPEPDREGTGEVRDHRGPGIDRGAPGARLSPPGAGGYHRACCCSGGDISPANPAGATQGAPGGPGRPARGTADAGQSPPARNARNTRRASSQAARAGRRPLRADGAATRRRDRDPAPIRVPATLPGIKTAHPREEPGQVMDGQRVSGVSPWKPEQGISDAPGSLAMSRREAVQPAWSVSGRPATMTSAQTLARRAHDRNTNALAAPVRWARPVCAGRPCPG